MSVSRRSLLKRAWGGATSATLGTLAGCLGGSGGDRERGRLPYSSWVYDPEAVDGSPYGSFFALDLAAVNAHEDALRRPTAVKYRNYVDLLDLEFLGVDTAVIDGMLQTYPVTSGPVRSVVLTGEHRPDRIRATLESSSEERTRYREFDLYWDIDGRRVAVGVGDRHVLLGYASETTDGRAVVRTVIEAWNENTRYAEASADFATLTEVLGQGDDVSGLTHPPRTETTAGRGVFENAVAKGHRYDFGRSTSRSRYVFVFATEADVDLRAVRTWVEANDDADDRLFGAYEDVTVSRVGRTAVVDGIVPTRAI